MKNQLWDSLIRQNKPQRVASCHKKQICVLKKSHHDDDDDDNDHEIGRITALR